MEFILLLVAIFLIVKGVVSQIGKSLFSGKDFSDNNRNSKTIINNYTTENHLHISKEDLKSITKSNK